MLIENRSGASFVSRATGTIRDMRFVLANDVAVMIDSGVNMHRARVTQDVSNILLIYTM
jgi:hypothetical protein